MSAPLDWLNSVLFTVLGQQVTVVEVIGFVAGALCLVGVTRQRLWNWPVGILNNLAFLALFLGTGLYTDAALQVVFVLLGVYGWLSWGRRPKGAGPLPIRRATGRQIAYGVVLTALGTVVVAFLLTTETDSAAAWPDAFILSASLLATWTQARKLIEHWWVWIVVDAVSVPLYVAKGLWLNAVLFLAFLALCVYGLARWTRELRAATAGGVDEAALEDESESLPV